MTPSQEMEQVYSYNPGARMGREMMKVAVRDPELFKTCKASAKNHQHTNT